MGKRLIFLGWDRPVVESVAEWLLPAVPSDPPDFSRQLILAPTRQAGRRLRQAVARRCAEGETGLLGLQVATPAALLEGRGDQPDAAPLLLQSVWAAVLQRTKPDAFPALLPVKLTERSFRWCLQTGALVQRLREQLAETGLTIADVPEKAGDRLAEPERWRDLARLEACFLAALNATGFGDPCTRKRGMVTRATLPEGVDSIILAGVADPPELVLQLLDRLSESLPVTVLVHAPATEAALFDSWGRPLPEAWSGRQVDIPDEERTLILAANPEDQARRVLQELDAAASLYGAGDVAIGVPDPEVAPVLSRSLAARRLAAFDPAEPPLSRQPVCRLLVLLQALAGAPSYRAAADLLRHADVLQTLSKRHGLSPVKLLNELDEFQNAFLPQGLDDFTPARMRGLEDVPDLHNAKFPVLERAVASLREWQALLFSGSSAADAVRQTLQAIYRERRLADEDPRDREFTAAASEINSALSELDAALRLLPQDRAEALELLNENLAARTLARERDHADLDLEGWLELPWNPAPFLLVTGLNEGLVPDSRMGDVFLPDSLRAHLGMRHDGRRFARDLFLLESLIESRRHTGAIRLLCGKTSAAGDPLKPSRLLFQCPDEALPARAARLFEELSSPALLPPASVTFKLQPVVPGRPPVWPADRHLSVTAFKDYMECPFRFYLKHLLRMESLDDLKTETDPMEFGQLIHYAMQQLHEQPQLRDCADATRLTAVLHDAAEGWMRSRFGNSLKLAQTIVLESAKNRLSAAARRQADEAAAGWVILSTEQSWSVKLGGLTIKGRIDRIDFHPKTRMARILDYKTSQSAKPCQDTHLGTARPETPPYALVQVGAKQKRWTDLQLPLYALMWNDAPLEKDARLTTGYFLIPPSLEDTRVQCWDELSDSLLESARRCAEGVCEAVRGGLFWPPAGRIQYEDLYGSRLGGELETLFTPFPGGAP